MTTGTNPFTSASISGYNSSPPDDDGSQTSANRVSWSKHKTKLADPIKTLAEADISNTSAAFAKTINTDDGVKNLLDGSLAFGSDELTISSGSVTADRSAHTIDTESDAATDDLSNIVGTSVYTGTILHLYAEDAARVVTVKNQATGAGEIHTKDEADVVLSTEFPLVLRYDGTDWYEVSRPQTTGLGSVQVFTSNGTWTKPAGIRSIFVEVRGGGGGGGGASNAASIKGAGGGGQGGRAVEFLDVTSSTSETVTVGAGGSGGTTSGTTGSAGGTTSFGSLLSATGGAGGEGAVDQETRFGGTGGAGSGGDANFTGQSGGAGNGDGSVLGNFGGCGGGEGGGRGGHRGDVAGTNGTDGTGGGGGGATCSSGGTAKTGGDGGDGYVIVWEYK